MAAEKVHVRSQVDEILERAEADKKLKYRSTDVAKEVEPELDLGNLLLQDQQPIPLPDFRSNTNGFLDKLARDNTQLLFNQIWKLPIERFEDVILATLPKPTTVVPRSKRVPKPRPPTKWETFARHKGIQQKKKDRMLWDEEAKDWKPRFGYKRVNDADDKWMIEVPDQADSKEDQFEKLDKVKKEKVAKNELQRLRNIAKNRKGGINVLSTELKPEERKSQDRITKELSVVRSSTASLGRFQKRLPKEKDKEQKGTKRKFNTVSGDHSSEKRNVLDIWNKINNPSIMDKNQASKKMLAENQSTIEGRSKGKRSVGSRVKNRVFKKNKTGNTAAKRGTAGKSSSSSKKSNKKK